MGLVRARETPGEERISCDQDCEWPKLEAVYAHRVRLLFLTCIATDRLTGRTCGSTVWVQLDADGAEKLDKLPPASLHAEYLEGERYAARQRTIHA